MRRNFLRRVAIVVALFFGLTVVANALAVVVLSRVFGLHGHRRLAPFIAIVGVSLIVAFVATGRAVRRMAEPMGEVMEAAERVAAGDYEVKVRERGPREMRRLSRAFNAMVERLREAEQRRRDFLADVAHELRTPLSVIRGNAEGMVDGVYPSDRAHLERVLEETRVMSRLLEDLLMLSTAEAGALRLHREPVEPGRLVEDAVRAFRPRAEAAGLTLEARVAAGLPALDADPVRLSEILSNLLSNALRHTPSGGSVTVSAEAADGRRSVALSVSDSGPGIAPEVLPHVFERFVKSADSGGAGLGLAIARSLVEAHGGEITAQSRPGEGTTMRVVLPITGAPQPGEARRMWRGR
jgi:two-component system OmpR family sensor kinase/two-component system sensor histidine kinase BaeS